MTPEAKRIIAKEFLYLIIPILTIILIGFFVALYIDYKQSSYWKELERVQEVIVLKLDSLEREDLAELERIKTKIKNYDKVKMSVELGFIAEGNDLPNDIYGNPRHDVIFDIKRSIEESQAEVNNFKRDFFGRDGYDGMFGSIYVIWLTLIYPIRALFMAIRWSIKVLREEKTSP